MNFSFNTKNWNAWFDFKEKKDLPLCVSVDIRDAGFKMAVVDTNLFPSGFNNLCDQHSEEASQIFHEAIQSKKQNCRHVILIAENHTRNTWYLENLYSLSQLLSLSGYQVRIVAPFSVKEEDDPFFGEKKKLFLKTELGHDLTVESLEQFITQFKNGNISGDVVIMNNDLIAGIPEGLMDLALPVYPTPLAGWHKRRKSEHFFHMNRVVKEFAQEHSLDPWLFSCLYRSCSAVDIHAEEGRKKLSFMAEELFDEICEKYREYGIKTKPFLFLKADYGTYGMGVHAIDDPKKILSLNRKIRKKMHKGKNASIINQFLIQEGVPTALNVDGKIGELCLYQIMNRFIGAFYRTHALKNERENLNVPGMSFSKICLKCSLPLSVLKNKTHFDLYKYLGRLAGLAAFDELEGLTGGLRT